MTKQLCALLPGVFLFLGGCGGGGEAELELGETGQAIHTALLLFSAPDLNLASVADQTCFLVGIRGSLKGYPGANGPPSTKPRVGVYQKNGRWRAQTDEGNGNGVAGTAACIPYVKNRVSLSISEGSNPHSVPSGPSFPNRQCFLTNIWGYGQGWTAINTYTQPERPPGVWITHHEPGPTWGGVWVVGESLLKNTNGDSSGGGGFVCVDIPHPIVKEFTVKGPVANKKLFTNLGNNGGYTCGLTSILGVFRDTGINDPGIDLFQSGGDWHITLGPQHEARVHCVLQGPGYSVSPDTVGMPGGGSFPSP
jgi:hypothetical protein